MNTTERRLGRITFLALALAGLRAWGGEDAPGWWFEAGPAVRVGMSASARGPSYVQKLGLHDPTARGPLSPPAGVGSATGYAERTYDNGYVKQDPGTGNPTSLDPNTTWNWGYNNASQYNAGAQTLSFQAQSQPGYNTLANHPVSGRDDMTGVGLQLMAGHPLTTFGNWSVDMTFGFQGLWGATAKINAVPYREDVRRVTVTDTYDVSGIPAGGFPAAGFHGTYLGPFDHPPVVPSPVIPNKPGSRMQQTSAPLSTSQDAVSFDLQQSLYQFSVGPRVGWKAAQRLSLTARPTVSLNLVDAAAQRTELFTQTSDGGTTVRNRWHDEGSKLGVSCGLGLTAGVEYDLGRGFYANLFGGYEWVMNRVDVRVGPDTLVVDPSGWTAGAAFGVRF